MPKRRRNSYFKNVHVQAWLEEPLANWFIDYLQKHSYGDTFADMLKVFLYKLRELDKEGINFANAREAEKIRREKLLKDTFANVTEAELICVRNLPRKDYNQADREMQCGYCKLSAKDLYKACQELKQEFTDMKNSLGIEQK